MIVDLKNEDFNELIKEGITIVDFYANWCGPCKMLGPILEEIALEKNIKLVKINVDNNEELAKEYRVMSIPNVYIFKDNEIVYNFIGYKTKIDILKEIDKLM